MNLEPSRWTDADSGNYIEIVRNKDGIKLFAVRNIAGSCLNKDGEWEFEPLPSNRSDEFFLRCRYETFEAASSALETHCLLSHR